MSGPTIRCSRRSERLTSSPSETRQLAESQLGTVGSGNHYVNLMQDDEGQVWVGVHFGSRGFGHKTASGFLALAAGKRFDERGVEGEMDSPPVLFEVGSELGDAYIAAMELAGEYAYAGRDIVVGKVLEILAADAVYEVHNHHNFAWREEHFGGDQLGDPEGCTPARPGQEGFVGGSMGDDSVILEGVGSARPSRRSARRGTARDGNEPLAGRRPRASSEPCSVLDGGTAPSRSRQRTTWTRHARTPDESMRKAPYRGGCSTGSGRLDRRADATA